jgi:spoIIIJ-associated protein
MESKGSIFEGKTLDDAVRKGLDALGLSRAEVMITVVEEGSGGFLGLGSRPYRVRVMPRPGGAFREPPERGGRDRDRSGRRPARGERRGERAPDRGRAASRGPRRERHEERREERRHDGERREQPAEARPVSDERRHGDRRGPVPAEGADDASRRRRRGRRGGRGRGREREREPERPRPTESDAAHAAGPRVEETPTESRAPRDGSNGERERGRERFGRGPSGRREPRERSSAATAEGPGLSPEELTELGQRTTTDLLKAMGFEARVSARTEGTRVEVTAEVADDEELLTGRKGEVRQALQHLLNRMVNRGEGSRYHLQLEINDFWQRREQELRDLARELAEDALSTGGERLTEYLNAQERRIVHVTLKEDARVKTYAIGEGLIKKVAVAPADDPEGPGPDPA